MKMVNLDEVPWDEWSSPGGKFHGMGRQVSLALGAKANAPLGDGGHPFDLEHGRLRPGKSGCPFHSHSSQWELYVILTGQGTVRYGGAHREIEAGEVIMHPPGEAHQLINTGSVDLEYFLFADNPPVDVWHYPDSNKWGFRPNGGIFRRLDVDYHLDEEDGISDEVKPVAPFTGPEAGHLARWVRIVDVMENHLHSPKRTYESFTRDISLALGGIRDVGPWAGGHPFDLQMRRVPPRAAVCPMHAHTIQWELFVVLSGKASVRTEEGSHAVRAGDVFIQAPGTAHQILNTGGDDFTFYVVADNSPADIIRYPESDKWMIKPQRKVFRMTEVDYFDGEE